MFELLVPATNAQQNRARAESTSYDCEIRPGLVLQTIRTLQDAGVEPDVWKIEGLDRREDCERVVATARRDGRGVVACIVLGRGADHKKVTNWLQIAASVPGFIGFAVGRSTFWDPIADFVAKNITRDQAAARIAERYGEWAVIFERARRLQANVA
jgi:myo-inositol catabolism protein IolC